MIARAIIAAGLAALAALVIVLSDVKAADSVTPADIETHWS